MRPREPIDPYVVFISCAEDAKALRTRVTQLVEEVFSPQLRHANALVRIEVEHWKRTTPKKAYGGDANARFVELARSSDLTLVLLRDRIGRGTREEIEAVLDEDEVELSVLWFPSKNPPTFGGTGNPPLSESAAHFLEQEHKNDITWEELPSPNSNAGWFGVVRVVLSFTLAGIAQTTGPLSQRRPR